MTRDRWKRLCAVFEGAIELPAEQRSSYLAAETGGDEDLRQAVSRMIESHEQPGDFLERPALTVSSARLGSWRIVREIGRGGMGIVYLGERADGVYQQKVAIKIVPGGVHSEIAVLARLEHPAIARLLDGGSSEEGFPYLVMEYVEGIPLDAWMRRENLSRPQRLRLFQQICGAVQYAHQNLVLHRDLKPSNILITNEGKPKLLDFGIAKLLNPAGTGEASPPTGAAALTPDYASPEQIRQQPLTTASDIYTLGVLLYELVTGNRPYTVQAKGLDEVVRMVCEKDPPAPSAVGQSSRDLDAIVLKAMHKNPAARYASAESLAADIDRYLVGHPVQARAGGRLYELRKFARHYRRGLSAVAAAITIFVIAGGVMSWQARVARQRFDYVRSLATAMVFEIHDDIAKLPGATLVRERLVSSGLQYLKLLAADAGANMELLNEVASGYLKLGEVLGRPSSANLGHTDQALDAWRKAENLATQVLRRDPKNVWAMRTLLAVNSYSAEVEESQGRFDQARRRRENGVSLAEKAVASGPPGDLRFSRSLGAAYYSLSGSLAQENPEQSLKFLRKARDVYQQLLDRNPEDNDSLRNFALCQKRLGSQMMRQGSLEEGITLLKKAIALDEYRFTLRPNDTQARLDLAVSVSELGFHLNRQDRHAEALPYFERSYELRRELYAADPKDHRLGTSFVYSLNRLADARSRLGKPNAALPLYREAMSIASRQGGLTSNMIWAYEGFAKAAIESNRVGEGCSALGDLIRRAEGRGSGPLPKSIQARIEPARVEWRRMCAQR